MNLDKIVTVGSRPWLPSSDAKNLDIWHEDDVPLIGTFDVPDAHVLFSIVGTPDKGTTAWGYVVLDDAEYAELSEKVYDTAVAMDEDVHRRFASRYCVFATASDFKVTAWSPTDEPVSSLLEGATNFLRDYITVVKGEVATLKRQMDAMKRRLDSIHTGDVPKPAPSDFTIDIAFADRPLYVRPKVPKSEREQIEVFEATQAQAEHLV